MKVKDILRHRLKQLRGNLESERKNAFEAKINHNIVAFCQSEGFSSIAGYYPNAGELSVLPALKELNTAISLPFVENKQMSFVSWDLKDESLVYQGLFLQPRNGKKVKPDAILVPCLGYDLHGHRIGYGGGFYDKTLSNYPDAVKIVVGFGFQELIEVPNEPHDIACDYIINETGSSAAACTSSPTKA